jgi:magnesium transporter
VRRVPTTHPGERVARLRDSLAGQRFEFSGDIAVLDGPALVGLLPMESLLAADPPARVSEVMDRDPPVVAPGLNQEQVAWKMVERAESSVAVVDDAGSFVGLIPPYHMLSVLLEEHDQDLARLSGFTASSNMARDAAEEPLRRRFGHRLPWLTVGLLGAMATAVLVGAFEQELSENVLLALFVPAVVYLANAVGQQTATVIIRGFTARVQLRPIAWREVLTGAALGAVIAVAFLPFVAVLWGDVEVAAAVSIAIFASCIVATVVALALPWLLTRRGLDPAFGSGPLATVLQDLLSIAVYFAVAVALNA